MRFHAHALLLLLTGFLSVRPAAAQEPAGWDLVWADEFTQANGTAPDPAKWGYETGGWGWGNNEKQFYTERRENSRIEDGNLVIEARAENYEEWAFTSARLITKNKASWTHGRIEARIRIPRGKGIWPAFWMLGTNIDAVGWPNCGEIDIMENIGSAPSTVHGTVHGPGYSGGGGIGGSYVLQGAQLADDFHVYAVEWEAARIRWFIDGQQYFSLTPAQLPAGSPWVFNSPHFLLLNVAVGGNWPGDPDGSTVFPQRMTVDYVRVYKAEQGGAPGTGVLLDPDFESPGVPDWTRFGPNVYSENGAVQNGARSLKVFGQFNGGSNDSGVYQDVAAAPGQSFGADGWMFTPVGDAIAAGNSAWIEVSFRDTGGNVLSLHRSPLMTSASPAGIWQKHAVNTRVDPTSGAVLGTSTALVAPAGTASLRKRLVFRQPAMAGGSAWFDNLSLTENLVVTPQDILVTVDPAEQWLGYINVFDLPQDGGAYQYGSSHPTADLRAVFSGPVLELYPNSTSDASTYWYVGGGAPGNPGNKRVDANMYVEKTGALSGRKVIFQGSVLSNTLTSAHNGTVFIRDFAPDFSSSNSVTAPLVNGFFHISLDTDPGAGRHVQYGFQISGPNVWSTDAGPYGSVRVSAAINDPFTTWISGFDFPGVAEPDLTPSGDPDNDGRNNLIEFALDGNPAAAADRDNKRARIEETAGNPALVLTLPVRSGALFGGFPAKTAVIDQVAYRIEGSSDLNLFDREVIEIPANPAGMPALAPGWNYHAFRLAGTPGDGSPGGAAGFLRVRVEHAP
jgi:beta-glucanase (GH16 family)